MSKALRFLPLITIMLLASMLIPGLVIKKDLRESALVAQRYAPLPFELPLLDADAAHFSAALWRDKVVMINVFASWCENCAMEHETLLKLAQTGKIEMLGIAWKDAPERATRWLKKHGNPFTAVGLDVHGASTVALGLSGVPETFILDRTGQVAYNYKAPLTDDMIDEVIVPLVEKLQRE